MTVVTPSYLLLLSPVSLFLVCVEAHAVFFLWRVHSFGSDLLRRGSLSVGAVKTPPRSCNDEVNLAIAMGSTLSGTHVERDV